MQQTDCQNRIPSCSGTIQEVSGVTAIGEYRYTHACSQSEREGAQGAWQWDQQSCTGWTSWRYRITWRCRIRCGDHWREKPREDEETVTPYKNKSLVPHVTIDNTSKTSEWLKLIYIRRTSKEHIAKCSDSDVTLYNGYYSTSCHLMPINIKTQLYTVGPYTSQELPRSLTTHRTCGETRLNGPRDSDDPKKECCLYVYVGEVAMCPLNVIGRSHILNDEMIYEHKSVRCGVPRDWIRACTMDMSVYRMHPIHTYQYGDRDKQTGSGEK